MIYGKSWIFFLIFLHKPFLVFFCTKEKWKKLKKGSFAYLAIFKKIFSHLSLTRLKNNLRKKV